jgi:hypothetical protein
MALGLTHPLTEVQKKKKVSGSKARPARKAGNLAAICVDCVQNGGKQ